MIAFSTFQNLDPTAPAERAYLALASAGRVFIPFFAASALEAQNKARAWLDAERAKAVPVRPYTKRKAQP